MPPTDNDADSPPEPDAWAEADELANMSHEDFYRQLLEDVDRVAAGEIPGQREKPRPLQSHARSAAIATAIGSKAPNEAGPSRGARKSLTPAAKIKTVTREKFA